MVASTRGSGDDDLARVQDVLRVERALERAHHLELRRALVARQLVAFLHADAVLGADRAAEAVHDVVHDALDVLPAGEEGGGVAVPGGAEVEMDIAVADMAEADRPRARQG